MTSSSSSGGEGGGKGGGVAEVQASSSLLVIAGALSGVAEAIAIQPFDMVKVISWSRYIL
jgi:hypothetical protein